MSENKVLIPQLDQYAKYKNEYYLVVGFNPKNNLVIILDINSEKKLNVHLNNVILTKHVCVHVEYRGTLYLVSLAPVLEDKLIISTITNRVMKWDNNNGNRKAILELSLL